MIEFSPVEEQDLGTIKDIYDHYILNSTATFHDGKITTDELKEFLFIDNPKYPSFLIRKNGETIGYCFLTRYKKRQAYDRTAELSIYLKPAHTGRGTGTIAMKFLEDAARKAGIRVLIATLSADNRESIRLLEKANFTKCAHLKNVGEKFGKVLDVVMYEKELKVS
ncbi:MAG: Acetyltransferase (GNAT) family protein [Methanoregula sp. PtaU1.Bin051]|nr:MAG: Acetyltransferase (GNAT) family protein [Methanoregula sp. PtaU1.Bin051]